MTRAERLERLLDERELDALLVTHLLNVRYLTGFTGSSGACLVGRERSVFMTDFRYVEQAAAQVEDSFERVNAGQDLLAAAAERMSGRVGFEDDHVTVRQHERLREAASEGIELIAAGGLVERLRAVKEPGELEAIRAAARLTDGILEYVVERGLLGRTEREVADDIEREMRARGSAPSFPTIVASAEHGALPHAEPREIPIGPDVLVTIDLGSIVDGYCSDCTRTFATGELSDEAASVYEIVLGAQRAAVDAVRSGVEAKAVDSVARDAIAGAGHGERFGHGLGHGVGIEVHEAPRLSQRSDDRLVESNVVTVEPGVYLPGRLGVRIEDLVIVGPDGCENLGGFTKELTVVG